MRDRRWWLVPGVAGILFLLQWLRNTLPLFANVVLSFDGDVALHLLLGELMLEQGSLLATEPTNLLMEGKPFLAHEWLSELVLALSYRAFGLAGPILITAGLVSSLSVVVLRRMFAVGAGMWPAVFTLVSMLTVQNTHLHPRPHVVTWLLAFVFVSQAARHRAGTLDLRSWLVRALPMVVLWAQLHAGFLVVFPVLLAFVGGAVVDLIAGEAGARGRLRDLAVVGVGALLASGVNPWGFELHLHFLRWLGNDYMTSFTTEFKSPDFRDLSGRFLLGWFVLSWLGLALSPRRPDAAGLLLWLGMAAMALHSARHGALFVTLTAPFVALRLQQVVEAWVGEPGGFGTLAKELDASSQRLGEAEVGLGGWASIGAVVIATTVMIGVVRVPEVRFHEKLQPVEAADWIAAHPEVVEGRMFNAFRWGAYLAWRLYPERQVWINSWHDHLGEEALRRYFRVHDVRPGWQKILDEEEIDWVVYDSMSYLRIALDADPGWEMVHRDDTASIWVRRKPTTPTP